MHFSFWRKKIMAECGHETFKTDWVHAFGKKCKTEIPVENGKTSYCHKCLSKMAIKCAWCGEVIFIGDPITLYSSVKDNFGIPEHAVVYNKYPLQLVGCLRWDCAETGADRAGFWIPPGKVARVESPFEKCLRTGGIVIVEDLSKM